jgi:hypothetical protein
MTGMGVKMEFDEIFYDEFFDKLLMSLLMNL